MYSEQKMLGNDIMEKKSKAVSSICRGNDTEKSMWKTHRYFVDFESRVHVKVSTSNHCHNVHVDLPFKIDEISTNFPGGISMSNHWQIDEDVSIGYQIVQLHDMISYHIEKHPLLKLIHEQMENTDSIKNRFFA